MKVVMVGSIAYDSVESPEGKVENALGGSAIYGGIASQFHASQLDLGSVGIVGVVGTDFLQSDRDKLSDLGLDLRGIETAQGNTDENGIGDFYYAVPSGFRALCSRNLPVETSIIRPKKHFDIILYTGDEATSRKISGLEFKPDFVWIKPRSTTSNHVVLDSVRGER